MYPEDQDRQQQPPANPNLMGEPPQPFNYEQPVQQPVQQSMPSNQYIPSQQTQPPLQQPMQPMMTLPPQPPQPRRKSGMGKALPWVISGILLIFVIILAVLFVIAGSGNKQTPSSNDNNNDQGANTAKNEECGSKLRRYQNEDLDIRFCYPTAWGDVKLADGKLDPSDSGTRVRLSFAEKGQVHLGLVSDDWSTDVERVGICTDPSAQAFPDTSSFSAKWITEPATGLVASATRGLEVVPDKYLLQEHVDDTLTDGVCMEGYQAFGGEVYRNAAATYYAKFTDKIATPQAHISSPTTLISVADRNEFTAFVKSVEKF